MHFVGAVPSLSTAVFPLISGEKSVGGSPVGSLVGIAEMLAFAARHGIGPVTEAFPMSKLNDAMDRLKSGRARYRLVLENDIAG